MKLTDNGRRLIQSFEGLSLTAYKDADGYSIGYGHFGAKPGDVITRAEADRLFNIDIIKFETVVSLITPRAEPHEFDAMVSLCYNIGTGDAKTRKNGFSGSTVARLHNLGDKAGAADAFRMWNKSQGKVLPVLVNRREKERAIYLHGYKPFGGSLDPSPGPVASSPRSGGARSASAGAVAGMLLLALGAAALARGAR